jgi:glycosyltransferase involved in cell wall biosynthesis
MVFMEDTERAATLANEYDIDAGLHLNLTIPFSGRTCPAGLAEHQERIARFLRSSRFAPAMYHPGLASSFRYVVEAQLEEYVRLYGCRPRRIDGHHHMHLAANALGQKLLPAGTIIRPNFSFGPGEKSYFNRLYRRGQNRLLARRHRLADFFFDILPLDAERLKRIAALGRKHNVEIETHAADQEQYRFLMRGELTAICEGVEIARGYQLRDPNFLVPAEPGSGGNNASDNGAGARPHVCICICTYKRPQPLRRLLDCLDRQETGSLFSYSIVVADNDEERSAEATVREAQSSLTVPVKYCSEPARGIARARNKAAANAEGDFIAMIDDDEFPAPGWLLNLFTTYGSYKVGGVLGPVKRHFDQTPPEWLKKSGLYDRRVNPTGMRVDWREARTGNALVKRSLFLSDGEPFRPEFKSGEDRDFFRRKMEEGHAFVWSAEAEVFEVIPPARWTRGYYVKKALLQGAAAALRPDCGAKNILKSALAIPVYAAALPFALLAGQHHFMTLLVKLCDHAGKLLFKMHLNPIREEYVSD